MSELKFLDMGDPMALTTGRQGRVQKSRVLPKRGLFTVGTHIFEFPARNKTAQASREAHQGLV